MVKIVHLIPLFPFLAFCANILGGRVFKGFSATISVAASSISLVLSVFAFQGVLGAGGASYSLGEWLRIDGMPLMFSVTLDGLSAVMLVIVTVVGTLIQIYSIGYMSGDPRYSRYFAYMSLFMASMLGLVLADNLVLFYIFWEGVGVCSYLLISFWFERSAAARAGLKAFLTTRIGDTGLLIGILLLIFGGRVSSFQEVAALSSPGTNLSIAALLIFLGAVGKSAQFPLHVWLPDAMEGPTAVSALIHAATMVAAGVYLVARGFTLFVMDPLCLQVVAGIGGVSAVMAASMAMVHNDIKRVLAYSTISQLGLMMLGLGTGGVNTGMFHLMTHAFFKALLFLGAGSIIHAAHTQNIKKMGGLFPRMKITGITFVIGAFALAGIPPFAGFWSKDEILLQALHNGHPVLFYAALATSFMTAFYMARVVFLVLFGAPRSEFHAHESPSTMTIPLVILACFTLCAGFVGSPVMGHVFQKFVSSGFIHPNEDVLPDYGIMVISTAAAFMGIGLAYLFYLAHNKVLPESFRARFSFIHKILLNKYYVDEVYERILLRPCLKGCGLLFTFDSRMVDGCVNGLARCVQGISGVLRRTQTGLVQNYLFIQILGGVILFLFVTGKVCFPF